MTNIEGIKVGINHTLKSALEILDRSNKTILLLVDEGGILLRTVTDGDIRRLLISGRGLEDTLEHLEIGAVKPVTGTPEMNSGQVLALMDQYQVNQIPILDASNRPVDADLRVVPDQRPLGLGVVWGGDPVLQLRVIGKRKKAVCVPSWNPQMMIDCAIQFKTRPL